MNIALSPASIRYSSAGLAVAAALLAAGCGGSSSSRHHQSTVSLSRAADVSAAASGYKVGFSLHETVPSLGTIDGTGSGSFSPRSRLGALNLNLKLPPSAGSQSVALQMVLDKGTFYMKLPPELTSELPGAKPWLYVNIDQAGKATGIRGLGSLYNSSSSVSNPGQFLSYLRATSAGTIKNLGQATVNGVSTTHYSADLDLAKLPNVVPASERQNAQQLVTALKQKGADTRFPIQVWLDSSNLVRRIQLTYSEPADGQSVSVSLTENFLEYGPQPAPAIPSADEATNLLSLSGLSG